MTMAALLSPDYPHQSHRGPGRILGLGRWSPDVSRRQRAGMDPELPDALGDLLYAFDCAGWLPPPRWHLPSPTSERMFDAILEDRGAESGAMGRLMVTDPWNRARRGLRQGPQGWSDLSQALDDCWRCGAPYDFETFVSVAGVVIVGGLCINCACDELGESLQMVESGRWFLAPRLRVTWLDASAR